MFSTRSGVQSVRIPVCGAMITCVVCAVVGISVLAGSYVPAVNFNSRAYMNSCLRYYSVRARYCIDPPPKSEVFCYDVYRNTVPANATCWEKYLMASFHDEKLAVEYAQSFGRWTFGCYCDPDHPCNYYNSLADTETPKIIAIVFSATAAFCAVAVVVLSIRGYMSGGNTDHVETSPLV